VRSPSEPDVGAATPARRQRRARSVSRRRTTRVARRAAYVAAVHRAARGLVAGACVGQRWQVHPLAELMPEEQRLAANTLVSSLNFAATIAGPAIAGLLVTYVSSALVLGLDALTYAFLAVIVVRTRLPASSHVSPVDRADGRGGLALLRSHPELL